jgi:D-alanyl-D-alanine carboxypeptidase
VDTGQVLYARRPDEPRAIASLTKIMTALVVLHRAGPRDMVTVSAEAARLGSENVGLSELGLKEGEHLTVGQLLYAMMLQSANDAAVALADHVSASTDAFIALMNREAARDGFTHTKFYSPNGLDDRGYSSARSLAAMTRLAEQDPEFGRIVRTKFHVVPPPPGGEPRHIQNRNVLLWLYPGATGVKTGFTTKSEYCLVATAELHGARFVAVVLGDPTSSASFGDAASLLNYGFDAFVRRPIVSKGGALPPIRFRHLQYPLQAAAPLEAWVPAASVDQPSVTIDIRPLQNSPRVDSRVGEATFSLHGQVLGRVPVSVSGPPRIAPPPAASHRVVTLPWWRRGVDTMNRAAGGLFHAIFG